MKSIGDGSRPQFYCLVVELLPSISSVTSLVVDWLLMEGDRGMPDEENIYRVEKVFVRSAIKTP